jgi:hypothetical protein
VSPASVFKELRKLYGKKPTYLKFTIASGSSSSISPEELSSVVQTTVADNKHVICSYQLLWSQLPMLRLPGFRKKHENI